MTPIETDDHVLRARRTAAWTRALLGMIGLGLALVLPLARDGRLSAEEAALTAATIGLLMTSGRLTRELGAPLAQGFYLGRPGAPWPELARGPRQLEPESPGVAAVGTRAGAPSLQPALG